MRKTRPSHQEAAMMAALSASSDFPESSVGSSVTFVSTICTSTRMVCSFTSKASSRMQCHCPTWYNHITIFLGCSKQPCVIHEDHELDVRCLLVLTFDVWWMDNVWWSWTVYGGWTCRCKLPFVTHFWYIVDKLYVWCIMVVYMLSFWYCLLMDNGCLYICLVFGIDFWWMMVIYMFIFCTRFWWITVATDASESPHPLLLRSHSQRAHDI
jgi:hypothetical protein